MRSLIRSAKFLLNFYPSLQPLTELMRCCGSLPFSPCAAVYGSLLFRDAVRVRLFKRDFVYPYAAL